jgi:hypothetical protein
VGPAFACLLRNSSPPSLSANPAERVLCLDHTTVSRLPEISWCGETSDNHLLQGWYCSVLFNYELRMKVLESCCAENTIPYLTFTDLLFYLNADVSASNRSWIGFIESWKFPSMWRKCNAIFDTILSCIIKVLLLTFVRSVYGRSCNLISSNLYKHIDNT